MLKVHNLITTQPTAEVEVPVQEPHFVDFPVVNDFWQENGIAKPQNNFT
jgi:hypothetical protein